MKTVEIATIIVGNPVTDYDCDQNISFLELSRKELASILIDAGIYNFVLNVEGLSLDNVFMVMRAINTYRSPRDSFEIIKPTPKGWVNLHYYEMIS